MQQAIQLANEKFGPLTAVVNCAGIGIAVRTVSKKGAHPLDQFEKVLKVAIYIHITPVVSWKYV